MRDDLNASASIGTRNAGFAAKERDESQIQMRVRQCDANEGLKDRFFGATEVDEGRPLDVGRQRQASNQAVRLGSKDLGRERLLKKSALKLAGES